MLEIVTRPRAPQDLKETRSRRSISNQVGDAAAHDYKAASPAERRQLDALLTLRLTEATRTERSLKHILEDLGHKAQARGLTPELLDDILNGAD